jgi:PRTRC genetic system ParB family protein
MIKLSDLRPMENYRKSMDKKKMAELTESVKKKGVIQPILVRPNGHGHKEAYEIVFGSRRYQAATAAGLAEIPAMIREVSDEEALELQVIENSQREDPNPMEQGFGFGKLIEMGKHTAETLAAKLDHSVDYVVGRLKLTHLPKAAQDKLLSGEISIGHALQLTRLKNEGDTKRLLEEILDEGLSVAQTKEELKDYYGQHMAQARFDTENCAACQARTRNQTVLFPDARKDTDLCLDASCFFTKTKDFFKKAVEEYKAKGIQIITKSAEVDKLSYGNNSRRLDLAEDDYGEKPKRPAQCKDCATRAFFYVEEKNGKRSKLETGWICLDKKCLDKMNRGKESSPAAGSTPASAPERTSSPIHAESCRNRFLYREIFPRVVKSEALKLRLAIYHLLEHFDGMRASVTMDDSDTDANKVRAALFQEVTGKKLGSNKYSGDAIFTEEDYAAIAGIPEGKLTDTLLKIALAMIPVTNADVLLFMTPEAGIDLSKSLVIDKQYIESKTKSELIKLANAIKVNTGLTDVMQKPKIVEAILAQDLTGKLPKDIADYCELKVLDSLRSPQKPARKEKKSGKK